MKKNFVQGMVLQGGTTLAPRGAASFVLGMVQQRAGQLKASASAVLHSEAFSILSGFVMVIFMMFLVWFTCSIFY